MYNIMDSLCTLGFDEKCEIDLSVSNQPKCPNTLGLPEKLTTQPVYNIRYPSGEVVLASTGETVDPDVAFSKSKGMSAGAKAGIGIGVTLAVLVLLTGAGFFWWKRGKGAPVPGLFWWRRSRQSPAAQASAGAVEDGRRREGSDTESSVEESVHGKKAADYGVVETRKETW